MDLVHFDWNTFVIKLFWGGIGFVTGQELISLQNFIIPLLIVCWIVRNRMPEGASLFSFLMPKSIWAQRSARLDTVYYFVIQAIAVLMLAPVAAAVTAALAPGVREALVALFGPALPGTQTPNSLAETLLYTTLVFIGLDFGLFYSHYLSHRLPLLWCLHKVHHSPPVLVPFTAMRFHPFDMLWNMAWGGGCAVIVGGVCQYLFYQGDSLFQVFTNNLWVAVSYVTLHNFRHSHIWIMFPPRLSKWLISPAQHQLHHSRERRHIDKNMGYLIAVWDRMFGTLYVPEAQETFRMGVHGMAKEGFYAHTTITSLLCAPLVEAARYLTGRMTAAEVMGAAPKPHPKAEAAVVVMPQAGDS
jgi:sterol desaturase/sphingolipid hydroxylase (fatty acid hydroxylase superfamily)